MNSRRLPLIYILLASLALVIGLLLGILIEPMLFARMGSVTVLFGVMSEYSLLKLELAMLYQQLNTGSTTEKSPTNWHQKKGYASHVLVVVGTLVWGFGDMVL